MYDHAIVAPKHALAFIAVTVLLDTIGFGLIMPVQPALLVELTGESVSRVATYGGWLAFVYAVMQFICAPILGNLSDRYGRRPVLPFAVGSLGVDYLIMGLAPSLSWLFVGRDGDRRLDDVRLALDMVLRRDHDADDERAHVAPRRARRAG
jgi:MFS family permease